MNLDGMGFDQIKGAFVGRDVLGQPISDDEAGRIAEMAISRGKRIAHLIEPRYVRFDYELTTDRGRVKRCAGRSSPDHEEGLSFILCCVFEIIPKVTDRSALVNAISASLRNRQTDAARAAYAIRRQKKESPLLRRLRRERQLKQRELIAPHFHPVEFGQLDKSPLISSCLDNEPFTSPRLDIGAPGDEYAWCRYSFETIEEVSESAVNGMDRSRCRKTRRKAPPAPSTPIPIESWEDAPRTIAEFILVHDLNAKITPIFLEEVNKTELLRQEMIKSGFYGGDKATMRKKSRELEKCETFGELLVNVASPLLNGVDIPEIAESRGVNRSTVWRQYEKLSEIFAKPRNRKSLTTSVYL